MQFEALVVPTMQHKLLCASKLKRNENIASTQKKLCTFDKR